MVLCTPVERDVWFGERDLEDNDSSGDVFSVNTNILDLLPTFDPQSEEARPLTASEYVRCFMLGGSFVVKKITRCLQIAA